MITKEIKDRYQIVAIEPHDIPTLRVYKGLFGSDTPQKAYEEKVAELTETIAELQRELEDQKSILNRIENYKDVLTNEANNATQARKAKKVVTP